MNTLQIAKALEGVKHFCGVFARNKIPSVFSTPASMVINLSPSYEDGTHWIGIYIDGNKCCYFDSLGRYPIEEIIGICKKNVFNLDYSSKQLQHFHNTTCGLYCIYFIMHIEYYDFKKILKNFTDNYTLNDSFIVNYFKTYHGVNSHVLDVTMY